MNTVLRNLRVLDFGQGVAGPYCAQLLADWGADVVKVEPPRGDWSRTMGQKGGVFLSVNRNKRGICVDLQDTGVQDAVRRAAEKADIIVESFRPGVMKKFGLDYGSLSARNPGLVYCSITGFGSAGPNASLPAGDSIMQAYGGLMSIIGTADGEPLRVGNMVSDMLAGMNAFSGALLALLARHETGQGQHVQTSLLSSIVAFQSPPLTEFLLSGNLPPRLGNEHPLIAPSGTRKTRDGFVSFTVFDHQWATFCRELKLDALFTDPRFQTSEGRQTHRAALNDTLERIFLTRTSAQWVEELRRIDVLCAPINNYEDLAEDAQVRHCSLLNTLAALDGTEIPNVSGPIESNSQGGPASARPAPSLGEHTVQVLHEWGLRHDQADHWLKSGVAVARSGTATAS